MPLPRVLPRSQPGLRSGLRSGAPLRGLALTLALAAPLVLGACRTTPMSLTSGDGVFEVPGDEPAHHRLRFVDGQVSRNDSCMIRLGNRLNRKIPPMYVNGEPVGFC